MLRMDCAGILLFLLVFVGGNKVYELTDSNSHQIFEGSWLIMFYAPWCPACQTLKSPWQQLASEDRTDDLHIAEVDVTKYPALSGQFLIFNLPSIYYIHDGESRQYYGLQDMSAIESWVVEEKWRSTDAISAWRSPNSFLMKSIGMFFRFANEIRVLKNLLTEEYAIPSWIVYIIFIASTMIIGLLVGLVLVCLCDCLCPPKTHVVDVKEESDTESIEEEEYEKDDHNMEGDVQEGDVQEGDVQVGDTQDDSAADSHVRHRKKTK